MTGLDTNILVRFFAKDDPLQTPKARAVLSSLTTAEPGWVGLATVLELVWVMTSTIRVGRDVVAQVLAELLTRETIIVERSETVEKALLRYRRGRADFADCLIAASARAAGCSRTVTFDRVAARDAGMELVG
ncbi:MAG: type II toxin-antitoxin system VapC family toxin [Terracidiphilus sp.]|jgi:predicted nucleic-acid-binding protein